MCGSLETGMVNIRERERDEWRVSVGHILRAALRVKELAYPVGTAIPRVAPDEGTKTPVIKERGVCEEENASECNAKGSNEERGIEVELTRQLADQLFFSEGGGSRHAQIRL